MNGREGAPKKAQTDFSKGPVWRNIVTQSVPMIAAQVVQLLYNVVDRIYIGHMPGVGSMALTGIGLTFPLATLIAAFTNLFGGGGAPLFAIARGEKDERRASRILGQSAFLLAASSAVLFAFCMLLRRPILYLFGASDASYGYADAYLRIYLFGTLFVMLSTGLNGFINAQGFPRIGMGTVLLGAALNLVLDPLFIFVFGMGIRGAALATVLSQLVSFLWVMRFFTGPKTLYRLKKEDMIPDLPMIRDIASLGLAGFVMQGTNCLVQVVCNAQLRLWGGDLYVGVMTVLNSVREILSLPVTGIGSGAQPVVSYNYGAQKYSRVRKGVVFMSVADGVYTLAAWGFIALMPGLLISIFTSDPRMIEAGREAIRIYFFGFVFMALQFAGQSTFTSLRCPKRAVFFSLLRKAFIVAPLTVLLPRIGGLGVRGVFLAEPISNLVGGSACFITMYFTLFRKLPKDDR